MSFTMNVSIDNKSVIIYCFYSFFIIETRQCFSLVFQEFKKVCGAKTILMLISFTIIVIIKKSVIVYFAARLL